MKKNILFILVLCLATLTTIAQEKAKEKKGIKSEGAHQAEYNANTEERDHAADVDSRNATQGGNDQNLNDAGEQEANEDSNDAENETNTAGVPSRDVSSAGSPGVPSKNGAVDGTNTMQRAKLNTAGSPIPGSSGKTESARTSDTRKTGAARPSDAASKAKQPDVKNSKTDSKGKKKKA